MRRIKIVVEQHPDGFVAYPLGLEGVVVGEGDTYESALADVTSAIRFHVETFGPGVLDMASKGRRFAGSAPRPESRATRSPMRTGRHEPPSR